MPRLYIYHNVSAETEIAAQEIEAATYYVVTYNDDGKVEIVSRKRIVEVVGTYMIRWLGSTKYPAKILFTGKNSAKCSLYISYTFISKTVWIY